LQVQQLLPASCCGEPEVNLLVARHAQGHVVYQAGESGACILLLKALPHRLLQQKPLHDDGGAVVGSWCTWLGCCCCCWRAGVGADGGQGEAVGIKLLGGAADHPQLRHQPQIGQALAAGAIRSCQAAGVPGWSFREL
jgi:hypothetical protein